MNHRFHILDTIKARKPLLVLLAAVLFIVIAALLAPYATKKAPPSHFSEKTNENKQIAKIVDESKPPANPELLPSISKATVFSSVDKELTTVTLPYSKHGLRNEKLDFTLTVAYSKGQYTWFRIIPDDCVEDMLVNDTRAPLLKEKERCNWRRGFTIDLKEYLKPGDNTLNIKIHNFGGPMGLRFDAIEPPAEATEP